MASRNLLLAGYAAIALAGASCRTPPPGRVEPDSPFLPLDEPGKTFTIENALPDVTFQNPVFALMPPGRSDSWFVGEREGRIVAVANRPDARDKTTVLDLRRTTLGWQDSGLLNMAFHPEFGRAGSPSRGYVYLWYNHTSNPPSGPGQPYLGHPSSNRLSRFTIPDGSRRADPDSELVLIDQRRTNTDHQGGGMFFHPEDGFLYIAVGDGGHPLTESRGYFWIGVTDDAQRIDRDLLSGLLRIDVDQRGGAISHPIRRQPRNGRTQGYFVPSDNPWLDPAGNHLEEFFAIGLRNPHRATYDPGTRRIFAGDVGDRRIEEVDVVERAGNYQWNFLEGDEPSTRFRRPPRPLGQERGPLFTFTHATSGSVIGGVVYRGRAFPELRGRYVFGDNGSGQIWTLDGAAAAPAAVQPLLRLPLQMTVYAGLSSFAVDAAGELYFCVLGDNDRGTGTLQKLVRARSSSRPAPARLSESGLFQDTARLTPSATLFPYEINAPFWSDHADKTRWIQVPPGTRLGFRPEGSWDFPAGTIAVKHFDLALDERDPGRRRRLETRVLVRGRSGGGYGRTYKWRPDEQDADLLSGPLSERLTAISKKPFGPLEASVLAGRGPGKLSPGAGREIELEGPAEGTLFAHLTEAGDFDVAASFSGAAGFMVRTAIGPESPHLQVTWADGEGGVSGGARRLRIERRRPSEKAASVTQVEVPAGPWIRIERSRGTFTVFTGADGHLWREVVALPGDGDGPRLVGLATGRANGRSARARVTAIRCLVRDHLYPGDGDCVACHTTPAGFVLGVNTRQWNREVSDPGGAGRLNQLLLARRRGLIDRDVQTDQIDAWKKLVPIHDETASLEDRVRSYLDVNCAQCHRPGMVAQVGIDARYDTPLAQQGLVRARVRWPTVSDASDLTIYPKSPDRSRLYAFVARRLMPPVGSALVHEQALDLLRSWIMELPGPPALGPVTIRRTSRRLPGGAVEIELSHPDPLATIHFTTDNTGPSPETPRYQGPFSVPLPTTVRAAAFRTGFVKSKLATLELREPL